MLHHYLEFIDEESVFEAEQWSAALSAEYLELENGTFNGRKNNSNRNINENDRRKYIYDSSLNHGGNDTQEYEGEHHNNSYSSNMNIRTPILFPTF